MLYANASGLGNLEMTHDELRNVNFESCCLSR